MPKQSNTQRDLLASHTGAGKGDADRSPLWRNHYEEIAWEKDKTPGFKTVAPGVSRKVYGVLQRSQHTTNIDEIIRPRRPFINWDEQIAQVNAEILKGKM